MIRAQALNKQFVTDKGQVVQALDNVSFDVARGEFFVLLGPSGSGKTTTLRSVAGIESADTGSLSIDGELVFSSDAQINIPPEERPVAMVFQSYALWPHMNVHDNIAFPLRKGVRRVDRAEMVRRIEAVVETLQLGPYIRRPISQLSGGQQQRVALARALALEPSLLLMDEPLSNLDAKLRAQLRVEIKALTTSLGITTLYVTHDQVEAMVMGDRIAVMDKGAIAGEGVPAELYRHPKNTFVAKFLGDMNFISGELSNRVNGHAAISTPLGELALSDVGQEITPGAIKLGFRPEHVLIGQQEDAATFTARILESYDLGDAVICEMAVGPHRFSARLPHTAEIKRGEDALFSLRPSDLSVFPNDEI